MKQTEVTCQVFDSIKTAKAKLKKQGFSLESKFVLNDKYFCAHSVDEAKKLSYAELMNCSILLREIVEQTTQVELIYKNKKLDEFNNVVEEEKYLTKIDNQQAAENMLLAAGMTCWCHIVQECYVFEHSKQSFCLQNASGLGLFLEFEATEDMRNMKPKQKIEKLKTYVGKLGLKIGSDYSCKKPFMLLHK